MTITPGKYQTALMAILLLAAVTTATAQSTAYLRWPDIHGDDVVFTSDNDLWIGSISSGVATRLTSHPGRESDAVFSPDGKWIAFTGQYFGNNDVFVMPSSGGEPRRLTYSNGSDYAAGWTAEGKVLFRSDRTPPFRATELYTVSADGGYPEKLPYLRASHLASEPGGNRVALVRNNLAWQGWNRYRGGQVDKIWVGDPGVPQFDRVSICDGNESWPMWNENGRIYFVTDLEGRENLWSMMPDGSDSRKETDFDKFDVRFPRMRGDRIVFQLGADIAVYNVTSREVNILEMSLPSDMLQSGRRYLNPNDWVDDWSLNEDGSRLAVAARGELFTLPVKGEGLIRRWTRSSGSREMSAHFLKEGGLIAITDATGEHRIVTISSPGAEMNGFDKSGANDWKDTVLPSPDGKLLALATGEQKLYIVDLQKGTRTLIDEGGWEFDEVVWSPKGRYLAYVHVEGEAESEILFVYDTKAKKNVQVSDRHYNTHSPAWDPDGRYLYCVTERDFSYEQDYSRALFMFEHTSVLALYRLTPDVPSPSLASGDVAADGLPGAPWLKERKERDEDDPIEIDFEGLSLRMEALDENAGSYGQLAATGDKLYFIDNSDGSVLKLYDLADKSSKEVASGVNSYQLSGDSKTIVIRTADSWYWGSAGAGTVDKDGDHKVPTDSWEVEVVPGEEWRQILREAWRQEQHFFYDGEMHAVDWDAVLSKHAPLADRVRTRDDLNDLILEIQAELSVGHAFIWGGDEPDVDEFDTGLLGVDFQPDATSGYYKITKVYAPEPGSPGGMSPLLVADPTVKAGTWVLAVNDQPVKASENIYRLLENRAGAPLAITLNEKPEMKGAREVIVEPIDSEYNLRLDDWIAAKREYVSRKSNGKLGYIFLPDMSRRGMWRWGRDYYPQRGLPGLVIDDRYNSGGNVSEYFLKELSSQIHTIQSSRYGAWQTKPHGSYFGDVAVLINGVTFSDGETFARSVQVTGYAPLIGTRTSGGGVWWWARRPLMDGGTVVAPEFGSWDATESKWVVEGTGVSPDIELLNDPASEIRGEDPQLDKAIDYLLKQIEENPPKLAPRPAKSLYAE